MPSLEQELLDKLPVWGSHRSGKSVQQIARESIILKTDEVEKAMNKLIRKKRVIRIPRNGYLYFRKRTR